MSCHLGLLFKIFSGEHNYKPLKGRGTYHPYSSRQTFAVRKCQIIKSQAFETQYYGHAAEPFRWPCEHSTTDLWSPMSHPVISPTTVHLKPTPVTHTLNTCECQDAHHTKMHITPRCTSHQDAHHTKMHITPRCTSHQDAHHTLNYVRRLLRTYVGSRWLAF